MQRVLRETNVQKFTINLDGEPLAVKVRMQRSSDLSLEVLVTKPTKHEIPYDSSGRCVHHGHGKHVVVDDLLGALHMALHGLLGRLSITWRPIEIASDVLVRVDQGEVLDVALLERSKDQASSLAIDEQLCHTKVLPRGAGHFALSVALPPRLITIQRVPVVGFCSVLKSEQSSEERQDEGLE